jgi:tRNA wybutosine-synthesizing protein 1
MIPAKLKKSLERQHYKIVGAHSAVKACHWLKKSLRNSDVCYKELFYPGFVRSHTCLQMTASISCCNLCLYCWRTYPKSIVPDWNELGFRDWDEPKEIIAGAVRAQRLLLSGFKGFEGTDMKKWREAQNPRNVALSLTGENLLYPHIPELIEEFHKRNIVTFLVTNGQYPERLEHLSSKAEPKQLYISLDAPNRQIYKKLDRPGLPDFWERLNKSLELMKSFSCRRVIRLTMVRGWNMTKPEQYAKLISKTDADFIEVKAYVWVGESRKRLPQEAMPLHRDVRAFAEQVSEESGYPIRDEQVASRVVLLSGR